MNYKKFIRVLKVVFAAYAAALGIAVVFMVVGLVILGGERIGPFVESYIGLVIGVFFIIFIPIMFSRLAK